MEIHRVWIKEIRRRPERFGEVYDAYADRIFQYVLKRTGDYHAARDITAETFLKAFLSIQKFRWQGVNLEIWLFQIALNEVRLHYRKKKYHAEVTREYWPAQWEGRSESAEDERIRIEELWERSEKLVRLARLIEQLPESQRECMTLKYLENFTSPEISEILGMKEPTVRSHISRGLAQLRKRLNQSTNG